LAGQAETQRRSARSTPCGLADVATRVAAGQQVGGFAAVAEEVRKLAEESQVVASQISALIGEMH
jgi:hypothetical protein